MNVLQTLGVKNGPVACTKACEQDNAGCVPFYLVNMCLHYHGTWTPKTSKYHYCLLYEDSGVSGRAFTLRHVVFELDKTPSLCVGFSVR